MRMAAVLTAACIMLVLAPGKGRTEELSPQARTILETLEDRPGECVHIAPAKTKGRLAVVSANAGYRNGITPLQNPLNDAAVMGAALSKLDFELYMLTDFSRGAAAECIDEAIAENPQVNVAVFHYSGHGIQIRDVNYLIGVDYAPDEPAADNDLIDLQAMLDRLTAAARSSMVFLDACRDNPFASADLPGLSVSTGRSAGSSKGGSTPAATSANAQPAGIFVAYSTSPNSTATDGTGDVSPFSAALARNIVKPGTSVQKAMAMVTREVGEATDWSQTPWSRSSLTDELILGARYSLDDLELASEGFAQRSTEYLGKGMRREAVIEALKGIPEGVNEDNLSAFSAAHLALYRAMDSSDTFIPTGNMVTGAEISPSGKLAAVATWTDETTQIIQLWDLENRVKIADLGPGPANNDGLKATFSRNDALLAVALSNGDVAVYDARTGQPLTTFNAVKAGYVYFDQLTLSDDGNALLTVSNINDDAGLKVWNPRTGELVATVLYHQVFGTGAMDFANSAKMNGTLDRTGRRLGFVASGTLPDGNGERTFIGVLDVASGEITTLNKIADHGMALGPAKAAPDLSSIAFMHYLDGTTKHEVWVMDPPRLVKTLDDPNGGATYSYNPENPHQLLMATGAGNLSFDVMTGEKVPFKQRSKGYSAQQSSVFNENGLVQGSDYLQVLEKYWDKLPIDLDLVEFAVSQLSDTERLRMSDERIEIPQ